MVPTNHSNPYPLVFEAFIIFSREPSRSRPQNEFLAATSTSTHMCEKHWGVGDLRSTKWREKKKIEERKGTYRDVNQAAIKISEGFHAKRAVTFIHPRLFDEFSRERVSYFEPLSVFRHSQLKVYAYPLSLLFDVLLFLLYLLSGLSLLPSSSRIF